jgi:hypothetical protein
MAPCSRSKVGPFDRYQKTGLRESESAGSTLKTADITSATMTVA